MVFDLDGTLYVSPDFAASIQDAAKVYMSGVLGLSKDEAAGLMADTRLRMAEESGTVQTLSAVCTELGGNIRDLHAFFEETLLPESYLVRDERVVELLLGLKNNFKLYVYTNNNRNLATRIIDLLGFNGLFEHVFTIDDEWRAKPDEYMLEQVVKATGISPERLLFVGDRYDVDLRLPELKGCPVFLTQNIDQLMRLQNIKA